METVREIISKHAPDLPSKDDIVKLCRKNGYETNHLTYSHNGCKLFIKYNGITWDEVQNQQFFYEQISKQSHAMIRIPEIYLAFSFPGKFGGPYIVMENIDVRHAASDMQRSQAIAELVSIDPPPDSPLGPIGGGLIKHKFFAFDEADTIYPSTSHLESHINRVLKVYKFPNQELQQVSLAHERMVCYYGDIWKDNFLVDVDGQVWVVDFDQAGVLPVSFMAYVLDTKGRHPLPREYRGMIPIEQTENLRAMTRASRWFGIGCSGFHVEEPGPS